MVTLVDDLIEALETRTELRRSLPEEGRIYIERPLPFLVLYRGPEEREDKGTPQLVTGEACYLQTSAKAELRKPVSATVEALCRSAQKNFGNSLLVEIWSRPDEHPPVVEQEATEITASFRLFPSGSTPGIEFALDDLQRELVGIRMAGQRAMVEIVEEPRLYPARMRPVLRRGVAEELNVMQIGIEVEPVYRARDGGKIYPAVLRALRRRLSRALKRAFFRFSREHTSYHPKNFHSLGRRAMVKAVWDADAKLDEVASGFDFLWEVNPINPEQLWRDFRSNHFEKLPILRYRPLSIDPTLSKRALYAIHLERIEDPTIAHLLRQKQRELDRKITMLGDRGTGSFLLGSQQLFGKVSPELLTTAEKILEQVPIRMRSETPWTPLRPEEFIAMVDEELAYYRKKWDGFEATVIPSPDVLSGVMVSRGRLLVSTGTRVQSGRADALIQHEVGTHQLTFFNGKAQRLTQLRTGLAGYSEFQEGLAVLSEYLVGGLTAARLRTLAGRVIGAKMLMDGADFIQMFRHLCRFGFAQRAAFNLTLRLVRGGGLTKDMIYLRGLITVLEFLKGDEPLEPLFVGKIAAEHVPLVKELLSRGILIPAKVMPRYLEREDCQLRLEGLRAGVNVLELLA